jgi:hypothetical protein
MNPWQTFILETLAGFETPTTNETQEMKATTERQAAVIVFQQKQIDPLTAGLQKVSAQLEAGKPAPQVVNNP